MDKPLPFWLHSWLARPGWQWLIVQWGLLGLCLLPGALMLRNEWLACREQQAQQRQLATQLSELRQQLAPLPTLAELEARLQSSAEQGAPADVGELLQDAGGTLQRWQRGESGRQRLHLLIDYSGLLQLLENIPVQWGIGQLTIQAHGDELAVQMLLQENLGEPHD